MRTHWHLLNVLCHPKILSLGADRALVVDGGTYNGFTVAAIGLTKAGKIQYRALSTYLISSSDFFDNYNALQQSCTDLIGVAGITSGDCTELKKALDAVEMSDPWPCTPPQPVVPELCAAGPVEDCWRYCSGARASVPGARLRRAPSSARLRPGPAQGAAL